jgi:hypothetical protein
MRNAVKDHGIWQISRSLSQGPFNIKEHFLITIFSNAEVAMELVYALDLVARFFTFNSLHSILDGFIDIKKRWM